MEGKYNFIYYSNYPWSDMYSRYICLALALAKSSYVNKLVFLDPIQHVGDVGGIINIIKSAPCLGRYYKKHSQPFVIKSAVSPFVFRRFKLTQKCYKIWQNHLLSNIPTFIPSQNKIALIQGPSEFTLKMIISLKQDGFLTIFDWGDFYEKHSGTIDQQNKMAGLCRELAKNADIVLGVSPIVTNIALSVNDRAFPFLNAVWADMVLREPLPVTPIDERLKQPCIGYFGLINSVKIDYDLVKAVVAKRPNWRFVFIGPQQGDLLSDYLKDCRNATFMPAMSGENVLKYLKDNIDLVFAPYNSKDQATKACSPVKLYETLAVGLPLVAVKSFDPVDAIGLISIGSTPDELINAMERELTDDSTQKRIERLEFARKNTWEVRAEQLFKIIESGRTDSID